ncbi:hypothetical protein MASR2M78_31660 [Treponema sp.]
MVEAGFKYNLSDILAAIGRVQLTRAEALLQMRRDIAARYDVAFEADDRFIIPPTGPADARHLYPLRLAAGEKMLERDDYIQRLQELGIGVSVHFIPLHSMPYYAERYELADADFPEAMNSFRHSISLPIWPGMSGEMIDRVITSVVQVAGE